MIDIVRKIIFHVLESLYKPLGATIIITILYMIAYLFVEEVGVKEVFRRCVCTFKVNSRFRKVSLLVFYTTMILFRTVLYRDIWENPFSDVVGVWGLHNAQGELTTEILENIALFIPFTVILLWCYQKRILGQIVGFGKTLWKSTKIVFVFSLSIECLQLFLRLGTFQLSDLFYNTLGGFVGGLIYWCGYMFVHRKKHKE